ncbi:hypothetical protein AAE478_010026 [Parahypoxylon ruwenzoriense]
MSIAKERQQRLSFLGLIKEIFNWYPSEYPTAERNLREVPSNAYVSGLKEDFGLYGNELNYFNVCYYVAYVVFQIPGMLLMSRPQL